MTAWNLLSKKGFKKTLKENIQQLEISNIQEVLSQRSEKLVKARSVELCVKQFKRKIREDPYLYVLSVIEYFIRNQL